MTCNSEVVSINRSLSLLIAKLSKEQADKLTRLAKQMAEGMNPDFIPPIASTPRGPQLASLLEIASALPDDDLEQLLFVAEDYYTAMVMCAVGQSVTETTN